MEIYNLYWISDYSDIFDLKTVGTDKYKTRRDCSGKRALFNSVKTGRDTNYYDAEFYCYENGN